MMAPIGSGGTGVWAVVTVFRPELVPPILEQVAPQVDGVIVVDDGSGPEYNPTLESMRRSGSVIVQLDHNSGIAAALNTGIDQARKAGARAVVTFDQDSAISHSFVSELLDARVRAETNARDIGPVVPEFFAGVSQAGSPAGPSTILAAHAIQSGMLIPMTILDKVGQMDESLFIDLVDTDFELRCADAGLPCIIAPGLRLKHSLGARYRVRGALGTVLPVLTLSTPFRYYYRARNRIVIGRRHRGHRSRLLRENFADQTYFLIAVALSSPRRAMWKIIRQGKIDARRGNSGAMPTSLRSLASQISWRADRQPD
nr:glycosyltransferase [uncultured Microbacterium sp.]